jgi:hypothetical protein
MGQNMGKSFLKPRSVRIVPGYLSARKDELEALNARIFLFQKA